MSLSDVIREWWNGPLVAAVTTQLQTMQSSLNRLETNMTSQADELRAGVKRIGEQVDLAVVEIHAQTDEIRRLTDLLAQPDPDLDAITAELNAVADKLDAAVPDAPPVEPVEPSA